MSPPPAECYAHPRQLTNSVAGYAVTYMFFNPYNGATALEGFLPAIGVHIGDWEHITVLVTADLTSVVSVYFARHGTGQWLMPQDCTFATDQNNNQTHVVVYSADGSHASHPTSGSHPNPSWGRAASDHTNKGTPWKTWNYVVDIGELNAPTPGCEWINYMGYWGNSRGYSGNGH